MNDLFGQPIIEASKNEVGGYARRPGSGPAAETCGTCAHCSATGNGNRNYFKCVVIQHRWTRGPGTDIRKKSPACELWETINHQDTKAPRVLKKMGEEPL